MKLKYVVGLATLSILCFSSMAFAEDDISEDISINEEVMVEGVATEDAEQGYETEVVKDTSNYSEANIIIDGTEEEVDITPPAFEYSAEPGDSGEIKYNISNESDVEYVVTEVTHTDSEIYQWDSAEFSYNKIINRLNKFDLTVKDIWTTDNLTDKQNSTNIKKYITEERLLKYYNDINETDFDNLKDAWNYNFFNRCWSIEYSKELIDLDVNNGDSYSIYWSIDGPNTDNAYQNCAWSWSDTITVEKVEEEETPFPEPEEEEKNIIPEKENASTIKTTTVPQTGDSSLDAIWCGLLILASFLIIVICCRKFK